MQTIEFTDGGVLLYDAGFLPTELADRYFVTINLTYRQIVELE